MNLVSWRSWEVVLFSVELCMHWLCDLRQAVSFFKLQFLPLKDGNLVMCVMWRGFPVGSVVKSLPVNAGDMGSIPGLGRSPREGNVDLTPVFLPGKSHGQRSLAGLQSMGSQRVGQDVLFSIFHRWENRQSGQVTAQSHTAKPRPEFRSIWISGLHFSSLHFFPWKILSTTGYKTVGQILYNINGWQICSLLFWNLFFWWDNSICEYENKLMHYRMWYKSKDSSVKS